MQPLGLAAPHPTSCGDHRGWLTGATTMSVTCNAHSRLTKNHPQLSRATPTHNRPVQRSFKVHEEPPTIVRSQQRTVTVRFSHTTARALVRALAIPRYVEALRKSYRSRDDSIGVNLAPVGHAREDKRRAAVPVRLPSRTLTTSSPSWTSNNLLALLDLRQLPLNNFFAHTC